MRPSAKNKADRMLASEERKLASLMPTLMESFSLLPVPSEPERYLGYSARFNCVISVHPIVLDTDGHPWLTCRFRREDPRPDLPWNAPENHAVYRDIHNALGANPYSGKFNAHIFDRVTAAQAFAHFSHHLVQAIRDVGPKTSGAPHAAPLPP